MKSSIAPVWHMERYKNLERKAHITPDDVLSKTIQEVLELMESLKWDESEEIYAEAGDVLANIVSLASELWCDIEALWAGEVSENDDILWLSLRWSEAVQALRGRYTRKVWNLPELESVTKSFISQILNYTNPELSIAEILEINVQKLMQRHTQYKPDIVVKDYIAEYPDFPKRWINFKDISPLLANPDALRYVCMEMAESCRGADKIVALDARGFIFAPMIAQLLDIPWIMVRKPGKLPWETESIDYTLEYGSNTLEIQKWAIACGEKVAIVDDLLATWGTALAAAKLVESQGGEVHSCNFVISLDEDFLVGLETRQTLAEYTVHTVVSYED